MTDTATIDIDATTEQLLSTLHNGGQKWFVQRFTKEGKRRSVWFNVGEDWHRFYKHYRHWQTGQNVYFGVNPTCESVTDKDRAKFTQDGVTPKDSYIEQYVGSKNDTISAVNCVFTEIDGKDFTFPSEDEIAAHIPAVTAEKQKMVDSGEFKRMPSDKAIYNEAVGLAKQAKYITDPQHYNALALTHLSNAPLKASVCWCSGGGYQAVWLFDETFMIDSQDARELIQWLQSAWVGVVGGDDGAKDIRRILRLPGTQNVKKHWAPNFPTVCYEWANFGTVYSIDQIIAHLPPRPQKAEPQHRTITLQSGNGTAYGDDSVINRFNATYKVTDILDNNGYTGTGSERSRPGAPSSNGVNISDDGFVSWHWSSNDPLYNPKPDGNPHKTTSFTAFLVLEHGGNMKEAVKAAAELLGMGRERNNPLGAMNGDHQTSEELLASLQEVTASKRIDPDTGEITDDAPAATIDDVLSAINAIANNAELKPIDRQKQIARGLSGAIGDIDKSFHVEIIAALEVANAGFTQTGAKEFVRSAVADAKKRNKAAERVRKEQARQNLLAVRTKKGKASIDVGNRQLSDIADEALQVLVNSNANNPTVFVRGGALVRIVQDERGYYGIQEFTASALMGKLADVADWETVGLDDDGNPVSRAVFPPRDVVNTMLTAGAWPGLPALSGIVNAPVFSRDGELHDQPGYSKSTRLFYTGGVKVGDTTPTPENIAHAKDLVLNNLLVDFPFADKASLAHAVAYFLLPYVRDMIDGPTPVHDVDSPTPGTGKGKLLNACAYPSLGHDVPTQPAVEDDNEWRKNITTRLQSGDTHLVIDNVNHELNSGALASAFTQPVWTDRTLGSNREVKIPIRTIWAITANNIKMSQELTRRCIWIRLDANSEKPHERTGFKHPNLMTWAKQNRDALVTAALTFVRAWVDRGMPLYAGRVKGSYEEWAGIMGGILETVGIPGFLENEAELFSRVFVKNDMMGDFVRAWAEKYGSGDTSAYSLFELASYADSDYENASGDWRNLLDTMLTSQKQRGRQTQLGNILQARRDTVVAGCKITWAKIQRGVNFWRLESVDSGEPQKSGEPQTEGSPLALPPVETPQKAKSGEPGRTSPTYNAKGGNFFSCLENITTQDDAQEKNNFLHGVQAAEVLPGSPLLSENEALPVVEAVVNLVKSGEPRFKVHHGKTENAIFESASYRCQSCETSKWSVSLSLIPAADGYNVLCEKCAARHG